MICSNCGNEIADGIQYCNICGASQVSQNAQGQAYSAQTQQVSPPALQLPTERSLVKMIFLGLITFGIYITVIQSRIVTELNIAASRYDGKRTIPFFAALMLIPMTAGIYGLIWNHQFSARVGDELKRRGYTYDFGAKDFWLWNVLGSLIIVGPFIYCHKLMKSMNMINGSYNIYG